MPKKKKHKLIFEFDNEDALRHFALWLCESGEQSYWDYMRYREEDEEDGNITAVSFEYHGKEDKTKTKTKKKSDPERYGEFLCDNTIRTVCGRMDDDDLDEDYKLIDDEITESIKNDPNDIEADLDD